MISHIVCCIALVTLGCQQHTPVNKSVAEDGVLNARIANDAAKRYRAAIETIATNADLDAVHNADRLLRGGGLEAISALRAHLNDRRIPPSNYLTRAVTGKPTVGGHCFWLIQDIIEPPVPKAFLGYAALTEQNVVAWLNARRGMTLEALRFDAAMQSLQRAEQELATAPTRYTQEAVDLYRKRVFAFQAEQHGD